MDLKGFGQLLYADRRSHNLTQEELAKLVGCSGNYISMIERAAPHSGSGGAVCPAEELVDALAEALGQSRQTYRAAIGYASAEEAQPDMRLARRLESILKGVDDYKRRKIEEMLETDAAKYVSLLTV